MTSPVGPYKYNMLCRSSLFYVLGLLCENPYRNRVIALEGNFKGAFFYRS